MAKGRTPRRHEGAPLPVIVPPEKGPKYISAKWDGSVLRFAISAKVSGRYFLRETSGGRPFLERQD